MRTTESDAAAQECLRLARAAAAMPTSRPFAVACAADIESAAAAGLEPATIAQHGIVMEQQARRQHWDGVLTHALVIVRLSWNGGFYHAPWLNSIPYLEERIAHEEVAAHHHAEIHLLRGLIELQRDHWVAAHDHFHLAFNDDPDRRNPRMPEETVELAYHLHRAMQRRLHPDTLPPATMADAERYIGTQALLHAAQLLRHGRRRSVERTLLQAREAFLRSGDVRRAGHVEEILLRFLGTLSSDTSYLTGLAGRLVEDRARYDQGPDHLARMTVDTAHLGDLSTSIDAALATAATVAPAPVPAVTTASLQPPPLELDDEQVVPNPYQEANPQTLFTRLMAELWEALYTRHQIDLATDDRFAPFRQQMA